MFIKTRVATKTPRSLLINEGYGLCKMGKGDERVVPCEMEEGLVR